MNFDHRLIKGRGQNFACASCTLLEHPHMQFPAYATGSLQESSQSESQSSMCLKYGSLSAFRITRHILSAFCWPGVQHSFYWKDCQNQKLMFSCSGQTQTWYFNSRVHDGFFRSSTLGECENSLEFLFGHWYVAWEGWQLKYFWITAKSIPELYFITRTDEVSHSTLLILTQARGKWRTMLYIIPIMDSLQLG